MYKIKRGNDMKYDVHDFYCLKCGKKGIPLSRKHGFQHERFHRKKLYCIFCGEEVNHIECKSYEDVEIFKENFEKGVYQDEAQDSLSYVRTSRIRKDDLRKEGNGTGNDLQVCTCVKR